MKEESNPGEIMVPTNELKDLAEEAQRLPDMEVFEATGIPETEISLREFSEEIGTPFHKIYAAWVMRHPEIEIEKSSLFYKNLESLARKEIIDPVKNVLDYVYDLYLTNADVGPRLIIRKNDYDPEGKRYDSRGKARWKIPIYVQTDVSDGIDVIRFSVYRYRGSLFNRGSGRLVARDWRNTSYGLRSVEDFVQDNIISYLLSREKEKQDKGVRWLKTILSIPRWVNENLDREYAMLGRGIQKAKGTD